MKRRRLTPDELSLWRSVAKTTEQLHPGRPERQTLISAPRPAKAPASPARPFEIGQKAARGCLTHNLAPDLSERLSSQPVKMDQKAFGRLKRGKLVPEGKIDLHGMTIDQAHPALAAFIMRAHAGGKRLVLVITGKGKTADDFGPIPMRRGVLRHNVPQWLSLPPLAQMVLQVSEAHVKHGGGGAYYVYLRRQRQ